MIAPCFGRGLADTARQLYRMGDLLGWRRSIPTNSWVRIAEMPLWFFRRSLRSEGLLRAIDQRLLFGGGEPGGRVHGKVEPRRHVP